MQIANAAGRLKRDLRIAGANFFIQRDVRPGQRPVAGNIGTQHVLQADGLIALHQLLQGYAGVLLPAADRHLLAAFRVNPHVKRQHQMLRAKTRKPAFHHFRRLHRRRTHHHARHACIKQGGHVFFRPHAAANLHRDVHAGNQRFQQRDLALRRIFRPGQVDQVQHFGPLSGIGLQARQRVVTVVALLSVIALMETDDRAVN